MECDKETQKILLPHHQQQELCVTRLPYRQGRKLTAVKVYSITKESNHLLIFGVPSLNLRQETKALFIKFGKLLQFNITKKHAAETFTDTYHAQYERIGSARIAKKMLDTKNFYGGSLHVCYAPEMETIEETQQKLMQRQRDVLFRLRNLENDEKITRVVEKSDNVIDDTQSSSKKMMNMGEINIITNNSNPNRYKRRKTDDVVIEKRFKPCFVDSAVPNDSTKSNEEFSNTAIINEVTVNEDDINNERLKSGDRNKSCNVKRTVTDVTEVEIVDCTSLDKPTISNINEALNYDKFGKESVFKVATKPVNRIKFNVNKKSIYLCVNIFISKNGG